MDYLHPVMVEALRGHMPLIEPDTPPIEAARVHADIQHQHHRERIRESMELDFQIRQQAYPGSPL